MADQIGAGDLIALAAIMGRSMQAIQQRRSILP
jgi:hypothetical protein